MNKPNTKITINISEEKYEKLKAISKDPQNDSGIKESINDYIEEKYKDLLKNSQGFTVKELFAEKIEEIYRYNLAHHIYNLNDFCVNEIKAKNISRNIKGTVITCPIENDIVISYEVKIDVSVKRYVEMEQKWVDADSYNMYIKTIKGEYVYISALNTLKTKEKFEEYQKKFSK